MRIRTDAVLAKFCASVYNQQDENLGFQVGISSCLHAAYKSMKGRVQPPADRMHTQSCICIEYARVCIVYTKADIPSG